MFLTVAVKWNLTVSLIASASKSANASENADGGNSSVRLLKVYRRSVVDGVWQSFDAGEGALGGAHSSVDVDVEEMRRRRHRRRH